MEYIWNTSPTEEILIAVAVLCFMFAVIFFLFALMYSVSAITGRYSKFSATLYWSYVTCSLLLTVCDHIFEGFLLFSFGAPVIAFVMYRIELIRKQTLKVDNNE